MTLQWSNRMLKKVKKGKMSEVGTSPAQNIPEMQQPCVIYLILTVLPAQGGLP